MKVPSGKTVQLGLGLGVSVLFLWLVLRHVDLAAVGRAMLLLPWFTWALGALLLALAYAFRILRWWVMLRALDARLPLGACVWPFLSSIAVNNVLPFRAGDVLRVFGFRNRLRAPAMRILGTLILERVLDLAVLLLFFFVGLQFVDPGVVPVALVEIAGWLAAITVLVLSALLVLARAWASRSGAGLVRLPFDLESDGWRRRVGDLLVQSMESTRVLSDGRQTVVLLMSSVVCWLLEGGVFVVVLLAAGGAISWLAGWFAMALGTLATLLPSAPGYLGTFDYFTAQGFVAYGESFQRAALLALAIHLILWVPLTVLGLGYLILVGTGRLSEQAGGEASIGVTAK